jgi:protocatechuate 3,4-dioxygenase beta subunit
MSEPLFNLFDRRSFMRGVGTLVVGLPALGLGALAPGCGGDRRALARTRSTANGPEALSWKTVLVEAGEPGAPLVVNGRVFAADGKSPVEGVTLHVYHTDARGLYSEKDGRGGPPDPRLKGWMKTDEDGRYEFRTIRPASYPGTRNPQHIHAELYGAGYAQRWVPEYWFDDDPLVTAEMRAKYAGLGTFSPVMSAKRGAEGVYACVRDIRLEKT